MGQCRFPQKQRTLPSEHAAGRSADNYIWTYVSPVFQMAQVRITPTFCVLADVFKGSCSLTIDGLI